MSRPRNQLFLFVREAAKKFSNNEMSNTTVKREMMAEQAIIKNATRVPIAEPERWIVNNRPLTFNANNGRNANQCRRPSRKLTPPIVVALRLSHCPTC